MNLKRKIKMNALELIEQLKQLQDAIENGDIPAEAVIDTLDAVEGEVEFKLENIAQFIKDEDALAKQIREEEKLLAARRKSHENAVERSKEWLALATKQYLEAHPGTKAFETPKVKLSIRNNPASVKIDNEEELIRMASILDWDCVETKTSVSLTKLKKLIDGGEDMSGLAHIEVSQSLMIK